jgi:S-adenosylmethionine:diacylglycerol 3-amino-3-carboxypropyl transferase
MSKPFHKKMTSYAPMYVYATEMVSKYYSLLDMKDKRVLSIVGSGDQIINAYFLGATEVVGFDINKRSFFMLEIKVSAILNLTRDEFIEFFGYDMNNGTFNFDLYNKLRNSLSLSTKRFFDKLYQEFNYHGRQLVKSDYFRQRSMIKSSAIDINIYLKNNRNYIRCRGIMQSKELKFLELDVNDILLNKNLIGKFDIINLSNVLNYLTGNTKEDDVLGALIKVTKNVSWRVKQGGLFFYYSYSSSLYNSVKRKMSPSASRLEIIEKIAKNNNLKVVIKKFKGVNSNTLDRVNIFKVGVG